MVMSIQYVRWVLLEIGDRAGPRWPFDPADGLKGSIGYHYSPDVSVVKLNNLDYAIMHYQDQDSRRISCFQADLSEKPNLLTDTVLDGMAAFGGRVLTPQEALDLAKILQPAREETIPDPQNPEQTLTRTYGEISLDENDLLTRTITIT